MSLPMPSAVVTVPVQGGGGFPVGRAYCIGCNYRAHAIEMGVGSVVPGDTLVGLSVDIAH